MLQPLIRASEGVPNGLRAASILVLPVLAFATNAALGTAWLAPLFVAFVALSLFTLFAHIPVLRFDGPLPFSELGVHVRGEVHDWGEVAMVEPAGEKDLEAVLTDGRRLPLRVRGSRSRDELRVALARYKPDAVRF